MIDEFLNFTMINSTSQECFIRVRVGDVVCNHGNGRKDSIRLNAHLDNIYRNIKDQLKELAEVNREEYGWKACESQLV